MNAQQVVLSTIFTKQFVLDTRLRGENMARGLVGVKIKSDVLGSVDTYCAMKPALVGKKKNQGASECKA